MGSHLTRRALLYWAAAGVASGQNVFDIKPDLGPRLNALWKQALGTSDTATIVSRHIYTQLPPLRGWRDERFLNAYIAWANRPEQAGFENDMLTADLGPNDWILLREPSVWVSAEPSPVADPIGYALLQLPSGRHSIRIKHPLIMHEQPRLPIYDLSTRPLPTIDAAIAVSADIVTLYGTGFEGGAFEIASETGLGTILYSSPNQVNARVPSLDRVRLTIDDSPSLWVPVQKAPAR